MERFLTECGEMSMQKAVLPGSMDDLRPCPSLSTLRHSHSHPKDMVRAEPEAKAQMEKICKTGVQVGCATTGQAYASGS